MTWFLTKGFGVIRVSSSVLLLPFFAVSALHKNRATTSAENIVFSCTVVTWGCYGCIFFEGGNFVGWDGDLSHVEDLGSSWTTLIRAGRCASDKSWNILLDQKLFWTAINLKSSIWSNIECQGIRVTIALKLTSYYYVWTLFASVCLYFCTASIYIQVGLVWPVQNRLVQKHEISIFSIW